ncbi:MAG: TonB-dependent receptor, partial [Nannocystaceae bacterium]
QAVEVVLSLGLEIVPPAPAPEPEPEPETSVGEGDPNGEATGPDTPAGPAPISGRILSAGQRTPVVGAIILAVPAPEGIPDGRIKRKIYEPEKEQEWSVRAVSDENGNYALPGVPVGRVRLIVLSQDHERLDYIETLAEKQRLELTYYPTPLNYNPYRTVVKSRRDEAGEVSRRTISVEEINSLPGSQGDALKSLQNFPGVARAPFGAGLLAIRGAAPGDSATYLAYHEIPQLFHFGGLTSVFNSDILTQIDFIPGNFDSRYGDAIGGIINVVPRKGRRDGFHGYIDSDLFDTGLMLEGPIGKGSFILSGRRSYIDLILPAVLPSDGGLDLTVAPRYWDYQALFDYPLAGGEFTARVFGSDDRTELLFSAPNDDEGTGLSTTIFFHRADLAYRKTSDGWDFLITPSYRNDYTSLFFGDLFRFDLVSHTFSGRAEVARQLTKRVGFRIGTEFVASRYTIDVSAPPVTGGGPPASTDATITTRLSASLLSPALYTTMNIGIGENFTLYPGARFTYYGAPFNAAQLDPRLRFAWRVADKTTLKGGSGIYTQAPNPPFKYDIAFGNPAIGIERSAHQSLGIEQALPADITLEVTGFYKYLWDLTANSEELILKQGLIAPELFASTGTGHIFGGELLARKALSRNLFGWVSYTLMRSTRRDAPDQESYLFDFDQSHILTLIGSYKLPRNWQIGARFRLVSGNPTTGVLGGVYDASSGNFQQVDGPRNGERLPAFHQLDIRVDKRWIYRRLSMTLYLDILNVYNHQNSEGFSYSYDFQQRNNIASLPILPTLGFRLEW